MKILVIDIEGTGLEFCIRCEAADHDVCLWTPEGCCAGEGIVTKIEKWESEIDSANLVVCTGNSIFGKELRPYFDLSYPLFAANEKSAKLELDRAKGQELLEECGIDVPRYEIVENLDRAISLVKSQPELLVAKPWGGTEDKSLSHVADSPADMIFTLQRWRDGGKLKSKLMLQEKIDGIEMGVAAWFGPGGWSAPIEENWEEKKFLNDGLGCNTGEMGTTLRYVKESKLFDKMLDPLTDRLHKLRYVGNVSVNCIIDTKGQAWPLEFTMRLGWPAFNITQALHEGDPAAWMRELLEGRDTLEVRYEEIAMGVLITHGDFPSNKQKVEELTGFPITGVSANREKFFLQEVCALEAPIVVSGEVKEQLTETTCGQHILVAVGCGKSVREAQGEAYSAAWQVKVPSNKMMRTDIGERLRGQLPKLQEHGYATGMKFK